MKKTGVGVCGNGVKMDGVNKRQEKTDELLVLQIQLHNYWGVEFLLC